MALRQTEEEQAVFEQALGRVAEQDPMSTEEVDSLSMLEADDLAKFHDVWAKLPAGARARLLGLRLAARRGYESGLIGSPSWWRRRSLRFRITLRATAVTFVCLFVPQRCRCCDLGVCYIFTEHVLHFTRINFYLL